MKNVRKQPKVSKLELLFQASKNGGGGSSFLELSPARLRPHLPKRARIRASHPHTPQISFASLISILSPGLRLAFVILYIYIYLYLYLDYLHLYIYTINICVHTNKPLRHVEIDHVSCIHHISYKLYMCKQK